MSFEEILKLIDHVSDSALTSFKYEEEGLKLFSAVRRKNGDLTAAPAMLSTDSVEKSKGERAEEEPGTGRKSGEITAGRNLLCGTFPRMPPPM